MTLDQYYTINNVYHDYYPDDRIDIQMNASLRQAIEDKANGKEIGKNTLDSISHYTEDAMNVIVYYPKITLTNDSGNQYTITDVYVKASFPSMVISLARTSFTQDEVNSGYIHSHVPKREFTSFSKFCTGNLGTPINRIISNIKKDDANSDFSIMIQSFIIEADRMIRVESNEGVPYISFMDIKNKSANTLPITIQSTGCHLKGMGFTQKQYDSIKEFFDYYLGLRLDTFYYDGFNWQLDCSDSEFIHRVTMVARSFPKFNKGTTPFKVFKQVLCLDGIYYLMPHNFRHTLGSAFAFWKFKEGMPKLTVRKDANNVKYSSVMVLDLTIITSLYGLLLDLINGIYANNEQFKDCMLSRAYKVKSMLFKAL